MRSDKPMRTKSSFVHIGLPRLAKKVHRTFGAYEHAMDWSALLVLTYAQADKLHIHTNHGMRQPCRMLGFGSLWWTDNWWIGVRSTWDKPSLFTVVWCVVYTSVQRQVRLVLAHCVLKCVPGFMIKNQDHYSLLLVFLFPSQNIDFHSWTFVTFITFASLEAAHKQRWNSATDLFSIVKKWTALRTSPLKGGISIDIYKEPRCPTSYTMHVKICSSS